MYITIIITAVLVNIDAFLAGLALGINSKIKWFYLIICASIGFIMCLAAVYLSEAIEKIIPFNLIYLGGALLILIGLRNIYILLKKENGKIRKGLLMNYVAIGVSVGTDMMVGAFSLSLILGPTFSIPVIFAIGQFVCVGLGIYLANLRIFNFFKKYAWLSGLFLIILGITRFF